MYPINKNSTRKKYIKKNNKTKRKVGKNSKKKTGSKNKQTKKHRKRKGGNQQTYYWSPMRKVQYNPDFDSSLSNANRPRIDVTDPVYNCKNPVTVIQTDQSGGAYVVGNNSQTYGDTEISTECPYQAQGASSYAYNYPPGLSNGLIIQNNKTQNGGSNSIPKVSKNNNRVEATPFKRPVTLSKNNVDTLKQNFQQKVKKYSEKKDLLVKEYPDKKDDIEVLMNELIELCNNVLSKPDVTNYNNFVARSTNILQELKIIINN